MNTLIFSDTNTISQDCQRNLSDCFFLSFQGKQALEQCSDELSLRERQLLRLLNNEDNMSRKSSEVLLRKVSVKKLIAKGFINQSSPCIGFCQKLENNSLMTDDSVNDEQKNSEETNTLEFITNEHTAVQTISPHHSIPELAI